MQLCVSLAVAGLAWLSLLPGIELERQTGRVSSLFLRRACLACIFILAPLREEAGTRTPPNPFNCEQGRGEEAKRRAAQCRTGTHQGRPAAHVPRSLAPRGSPHRKPGDICCLVSATASPAAPVRCMACRGCLLLLANLPLSLHSCFRLHCSPFLLLLLKTLSLVRALVSVGLWYASAGVYCASMVDASAVHLQLPAPHISHYHIHKTRCGATAMRSPTSQGSRFQSSTSSRAFRTRASAIERIGLCGEMRDGCRPRLPWPRS